MNIDKNEFAAEWVEAWNQHDLDRILSHYTDDFEITTPMIKATLGIDSGTLQGKDAVKEYWEAGLKKVPDLQFSLIDVTSGIDSIAIYYQAVFDKKAVEVLFFNGEGKVNKVVVHYT